MECGGSRPPQPATRGHSHPPETAYEITDETCSSTWRGARQNSPEGTRTHLSARSRPCPRKRSAPPPPPPRGRILNGRAEVEGVYKQHPDLASNPDLLNDLMNGIDWERPTLQRTLEPGEIVEQWVWKGGRPGRSFTLPGEDPGTLGMKLGSDGLPAGRELHRFRVTERISFVESTARTIPETPKFPGGPGGGRQLFAEPGSASKLVDIGSGGTR
jgi:hypothetical protein